MYIDWRWVNKLWFNYTIEDYVAIKNIIFNSFRIFTDRGKYSMILSEKKP